MTFADINDYNKIPYKSNVQVMPWRNREQEDYPVHWHTEVEIIMPVSRDYEVSFLNQTYTLREHDIFIVPPCELHGIRVPQGAEDGERVILLFQPALLYSLEDLAGTVSLLHGLNLLTPEGTPDIYEQAHSLMMEIYDEILRGDSYSNTVIYANIIQLYISMARYYNNLTYPLLPNRTMGNAEYLARLNVVFKYIEDHAATNISIEEIADVAHFSRSHFSRIFKKFTGLSFGHYLNRKRIQKTEMLLLNPSLSITEAALEAGFESITTFNRVFKELKKCTPSAFRNMHQHYVPCR